MDTAVTLAIKKPFHAWGSWLFQDICIV